MTNPNESLGEVLEDLSERIAQYKVYGKNARIGEDLSELYEKAASLVMECKSKLNERKHARKYMFPLWKKLDQSRQIFSAKYIGPNFTGDLQESEKPKFK